MRAIIPALLAALLILVSPSPDPGAGRGAGQTVRPCLEHRSPWESIRPRLRGSFSAASPRAPQPAANSRSRSMMLFSAA